jgi:hypothetical protein
VTHHSKLQQAKKGRKPNKEKEMVNRKQTFGIHVGNPSLMRKTFTSRAKIHLSPK